MITHPECSVFPSAPAGSGFVYMLYKRGTRILTAIFTSHYTTSDQMFAEADNHSRNHPDSEVHVFHGTPKHGRVVHKVK